MTLLMRYLLGLVGLDPGRPSGSGDEFSSGSISYGVQIGARSGKPLIMPYQGKCDPLATDDVAAGLHIFGKDGKPLDTFFGSHCNGAGELKKCFEGLGVHIGGYNGKPLILSGCIDGCEDGNGCCFCDGRQGACIPPLRVVIESPAFTTVDVVLSHGGTKCDPDLPLSWYSSDGLSFYRCEDGGATFKLEYHEAPYGTVIDLRLDVYGSISGPAGDRIDLSCDPFMWTHTGVFNTSSPGPCMSFPLLGCLEGDVYIFAGLNLLGSSAGPDVPYTITIVEA